MVKKYFHHTVVINISIITVATVITFTSFECRLENAEREKQHRAFDVPTRIHPYIEGLTFAICFHSEYDNGNEKNSYRRYSITLGWLYFLYRVHHTSFCCLSDIVFHLFRPSRIWNRFLMTTVNTLSTESTFCTVNIDESRVSYLRKKIFPKVILSSFSQRKEMQILCTWYREKKRESDIFFQPFRSAHEYHFYRCHRPIEFTLYA